MRDLDPNVFLKLYQIAHPEIMVYKFEQLFLALDGTKQGTARAANENETYQCRRSRNCVRNAGFCRRRVLRRAGYGDEEVLDRRGQAHDHHNVGPRRRL
jgi:hypothetical protein